MKKALKQHIKNLPLIGDYLIKLQRRFNSKPKIYFDIPSIWFEKLFDEDYVNIVQVGSNDGVTGDPLYNLIIKHNTWTALFIEPVPFLFEKLKQNYNKESRFIFENSAVNKDGDWQIFYSVDEEAKTKIEMLPAWYDQLGSFSKENITKHLNGILEPYIVESKIKGVTLKEVLSKHQIKKIDIMHIDTEGYDWNVLSQLDFNIYNPKAILFEHKHLSKTEELKSIAYLKNNNYLIYRLGADFLCLNKEKFSLQKLSKLKAQEII
nr:FkbM family methyltransferase [uncultured Psychroserpens sp.]